MSRTPSPNRPDRRVLVCEGRAVDDNNQPVGERCGRTLTVRGTLSGFVPTADGMRWQQPVPPTDGQVRDQAVAAGWSVGGPPMCDRCRRPDPAVARGLTNRPGGPR